MKQLNNFRLVILTETCLRTIMKTALGMFIFLLTVMNVLGSNTVLNNTHPDVEKEALVVSNLRAEFRHGQVFLIWDERNSNNQNLRVYISKEPITSQSLPGAQLLTDQLEPQSANDWYEDPDECPRTEGPVHGWIIENGRAPLDRIGGLFVHTVVKGDPQKAFFAVLASDENEKDLRVGVNSLQNPVSITTGQLQAIWQLPGQQPTAKGKPLAIFLHSHQGRPRDSFTHLFFGDSSMGWREGLPFKFKVTIRPDVVLVEPYDRVWINRKMSAEEALANGLYDTLHRNIESWWYGTNSKINDPEMILSGTPTNYTERWLMYVLKWVQQNYETNPNQVYAFGASMGTGVLRMVLQNPDRFASVDLLVPILDPFGEGRVGERMKLRVGEPRTICSDGMELGDRLNTIKTINAATHDLPPIVIRVGRMDKSVTWVRKPVFIEAMQQHKQSLFVAWDNGGHGTAVRKPFEGFPKWFDFQWYADRFALNMSYPALTNCSMDDDPGDGNPIVGDTTGFINRGFDWKIVADTKTQYEILLTIKRPDVTYPVYVDVTPRRYQNFRDIKKTTVYAYNLDVAGKIIERKTLKVENGLITYDKFAISSPSGNTLLISVDKKK